VAAVLARHGAHPAGLDGRAVGVAAVPRGPVAVVARLGALLDAVAALLAGDARHRAVEARLDGAGRGAAVGRGVVAVVAGLAGLDHAVAAARAGGARHRAAVGRL